MISCIFAISNLKLWKNMTKYVFSSQWRRLGAGFWRSAC